jgi:hypothetical protein
LDSTAEDYVEKNLDNIFKMTASQARDFKSMGSTYPVDTDGKAFDDPIFMADALRTLRSIRAYMDTPKAEKDIEIKMEADYNQPQQYSEVQNAKNHTIEKLDNWIEAIEMHENDKIVLNKMRAFEKGIRGKDIVDQVPGVLLEGMFSDLYLHDIDSTMHSVDYSWDGLSASGRNLMLDMGITKDIYNARDWMQRDIKQLFFASFFPESFPVLEEWFKGTTLSDGTYNPGGANMKTHGSYYGTALDPFKPGDSRYWSFEDFKNNAYALSRKYEEFGEIVRRFYYVKNSGGGAQNYYISSSLGNYLDGGYNDDSAHFALKETASWRDMANTLKKLSRRKSFDTKKTELQLEAIFDTGKALGDTSIMNTSDNVESKIMSMYNDLSGFQQETVKVVVNVPYFMRSSRNSSQSVNFSTHGPSAYKDDSFSRGDLLSYKVFSKHKQDGAKWQRRSKREVYGETKLLKNALKSKFLHKTVVAPSGYSYSTAADANTHADQSIAYMLGVNWQVRKLAKKSKLVPEFKPGNFVPYSNKNPIKAGGSASVSSGYRKSDVFSHTDFQAQVSEARQNSIASNLGLTAATKSGKKAPPKIVLKTSEKSISEWQKKIDDDWTHDSSAIRGQWSKGSVKVNHVFDVQYHDYYRDYKQIESSKGNVMYGYHGTDFEAGAKIIKGGFIIPKKAKAGRMLGDGVYIAKSSSKSSQYLHSRSFGRHGNTGVLLLNRIAAGKMNPGTAYSSAVYDSAIDTVYAQGVTGGNTSGFLQHDEYCVKNPKAVVPIQWIEVSSR